MASSSSSSPRTWVHDVFPSFSGEDVRVTFLSHFLKELDRKLITTFIDNNIVRGGSLAPELTQAIKDSRIAVVVLSKNYASSSWCLNELLEIMQCKEDYGQIVIPVFYDLDPSHVRKQTGDFGDIFGKTCEKNTKEKMIQWKEALTNVANILGFHSLKWDKEANMIEKIVDDVLNKLSLTTPKDTEDLVDIESHISKMSELLDLKSEEVRMVGIWGSSGIGKTTIARVLNKRISRHFKGSVFIDKYLISKIMAISCNPDDYNIKLHLQEALLSKILDKTGINVDHLDAVGEKLKHHKVLIFIDDVDDQLVLDALAGETNWFGLGSRIVVITKDKHFLRAQKIDCIYEVGLPTDEQALQMFCRSAFRTNTPPQEFMELASEVALRAGNLPLGLKVLGSHLRGRDIEDWVDMMPRLRNDLDGKIERTLRVSYDGLDNTKDQALFRYIACIFNGEKVSDMKQQLADITQVDVNIGFKLLVEKSLVHVRKNTIEMHLLLQEMGKEIVRTQSNKPGEREFLLDSKDICNVFKNDTGTENILGISLELEESDELHIHDNAFKRMCRLLFLKIEIKEKKKTRLAIIPLELDGNEEQHEYESAFKRMFRFFLQKFQTKEKEKERLHLPYGFNYLPSTLISLIWEKYPLRYMPFKFAPENLVKLQMRYSQLEKLWEGTPSLSKLKHMDLRRSKTFIIDAS